MFPGITPSGERRLFGDDSGSRPCIGRILRTILYPIVRNDPTFVKKKHQPGRGGSSAAARLEGKVWRQARPSASGPMEMKVMSVRPDEGAVHASGPAVSSLASPPSATAAGIPIGPMAGRSSIRERPKARRNRFEV